MSKKAQTPAEERMQAMHAMGTLQMIRKMSDDIVTGALNCNDLVIHGLVENEGGGNNKNSTRYAYHTAIQNKEIKGRCDLIFTFTPQSMIDVVPDIKMPKKKG